MNPDTLRKIIEINTVAATANGGKGLTIDSDLDDLRFLMTTKNVRSVRDWAVELAAVAIRIADHGRAPLGRNGEPLSQPEPDADALRIATSR